MHHRALDRASALHQTLAGDDRHWGLQEQLLAVIADELRIANWQRSSAGAKKSKQPPRPKPIQRPGIGDKKPKSALPLAQLDQILRRHNPDAFDLTDKEG